MNCLSHRVRLPVSRKEVKGPVRKEFLFQAEQEVNSSSACRSVSSDEEEVLSEWKQ